MLGMLFSVESALWGRRICILVFSDVKHFTAAQNLRTTLWFAGAVSFPESCSHFLFFPLPCVPWGRTWCLVPPSQPFLLGSSFSELVGYWTAGILNWWDTEHCLEEVILQPVDVCQCSMCWICSVPVYQCRLVCGHSILIGFIFSSNQPLNQVILTCLPLPLLFLGWVGLYFFTSLPFLVTFWERSREVGINLLFLGGKPWLKLVLDEVLAQVSRTIQLYWCCVQRVRRRGKHSLRRDVWGFFSIILPSFLQKSQDCWHEQKLDLQAAVPSNAGNVFYTRVC